jgi:hypothetical protein
LTSLLITRDFARQVIKSQCRDTDPAFNTPQSNPAAGPKSDAQCDAASFRSVLRSLPKAGAGALQIAFNALKINRFCSQLMGTQVACDAAMQALEMQ